MNNSLALIELPVYPTAKNMSGLLRCAAELIEVSSVGAVVDGSKVRFVDPCGMAVFGCVANMFEQSGAELHFQGFSGEILAYLSRMDAFGKYIDREVELGPRLDRRSALVEVTKVSDERSEDAARRIVASLLGSMSDLPEDEEPDEMSCLTRRDCLQEPLEYIFTELLDNVFQHGCRHSFDAEAWVCSQYFPGKDIVRLSIVDNGCGILRSLSEHPDLTDMTDAAAIALALRERISCNPALLLRGQDHSANQGVGLTVVSRMVGMAGGKMWIGSGTSAQDVAGSISTPITHWQGCVLAIEINRSALMGIRVHQVISILEGSTNSPDLDFS